MFFTGGMFWKFQIKLSFVFENIQAIKCYSVPPDIDDTVAYEVPIGSSGKLTHCKGLRPWGYAQSSQSKEFKNGSRLLFNCRGSYCCKNIKYLNRVESYRKTIKRCGRCVEISCIRTLHRTFAEIHSRLSIRTKRQKKRCRRYCSSFPRVTRESFIRQRCNRNSRKTLSLMLQKQHRKIND